MAKSETKWDRPEYTLRQVRGIAEGRIDPGKLNVLLRHAGKGVHY